MPMTSTDHIVLALDVERDASVLRLSGLTGYDRDLVDRRIGMLVSRDEVEIVGVRRYRLTDKGRKRARTLLDARELYRQVTGHYPRGSDVRSTKWRRETRTLTGGLYSPEPKETNDE